jgi:hypothetical protein
MGLDLNTALISDTFDGLIKTTDANALTGSPLVLTDGRGNNSSIAIATAGNGVTITGTLLVDGANIGTGLSTAQSDITAIETKTDFITVTGAVNLDTIKTKADFITVTQAVNLDTIESDILSAKTKTDFITVTQAVDLDTMESDILSAKTKTDFITIGQAVNLDNLESDVATAQGDITAIETKTDFITISSPLNLNTVASNASAAKTKTDFITITQAVNLDTLESDVNVAQGDITAIEAKTDFITIASALNLNTVASNASDAKTKTDFITITQAVDLDDLEGDVAQAQTDINQIEGKTNFITVTQAVNLDTMESDIATNNAKNSYPSGDATKVGFISVTQAVDLDSMETDISNLSSNKYDKTGGAISGNVTVTGDLTVNGTTTTINTQTLSVEDPLIELANDNSANSVDTGFYANYSLDAGVTTKYAGLFRDAGDSDKFKLFKGLEVEPTTTVDTSGTGYTKGDLVVNDLDAVTISGALTGNVSGNVTGNLTGNVTGNVTGDLTGDVLTAAQTNITSVGTLSSLAVSGNLTVDADTLFVDSTNDRVGINKTNPAVALDVTGAAAISSTLAVTGTTSLTDDLAVDTDTLFVDASADRVGINKNNPAVALDVTGDITSSGTITGTTLAGTLSTAAQTNVTSVGTLSSLAVSGDVSIADKIVHTGDTNTAIRFPSADTITFETSGAEAVRIDSSGNVGIGTNATTNVRLNVAESNPTTGILAKLTNSATSSHTGALLTFTQDSVADWAIGQPAGTNAFAISSGTYPTNTGTERMRITSGGDVFVGTSSALQSDERLAVNTTTASNAALIKNGSATALNWVAKLWNNATSGDNRFLEFTTESTVTARGSVDYNRGSNVVRYNTTSDANLKNIIGDSNKQTSLDILNSTRIREYSWKEDETNKPQVGVIAQELYETFKGAVSKGSDDSLLGTEEYEAWSVDKTAFTFHLIAGWQEHQKLIQEQQEIINDLKARIETLENK